MDGLNQDVGNTRIMNELDKWAAVKCGIVLDKDGGFIGSDYGLNDLWLLWTLDDARCREIAREHLKIITTLFRTASGDEWMAMSDITLNGRKNKTIAEAEIACIEAIFNESVK